MNSAATTRTQQIDHIANHFVPRASLVTRLLVKQSRHAISRTEGGVLSTLSNGPRRITELAELEGLAQPTMTVLVRRLQERGLVQRHGQADDGRVVLVSLTDAGNAALEDIRAEYRAVLRARLAGMSDEQVAALETATELLETLAHAFQPGGEQ